MTIERTTYMKVWPLTNQSNNTLLSKKAGRCVILLTLQSEGKNKEGVRAIG